jgi:hypothetical protein
MIKMELLENIVIVLCINFIKNQRLEKLIGIRQLILLIINMNTWYSYLLKTKG